MTSPGIALAGEVDKCGAGGRGGRCGAEGDDIAVADDDRLVLARRRAGAVNDAHVRQGDDRRLKFDEIRRRILIWLLRHGTPEGVPYNPGRKNRGTPEGVPYDHRRNHRG